MLSTFFQKIYTREIIRRTKNFVIIPRNFRNSEDIKQIYLKKFFA